ncbi:PREDICTED: putative F-box protein At5g51000 [Camelina sativa]|uniref:F-box protein At5g51000 n=1 Tax=Camelina sativa TaxID=90675 RepID=A0ABM0XRN7_CAMSA|nr:PREDICTED: putative F-box protein At5g51000 [Camelina sativa]
MTKISDLSRDLVEEILCRVRITSIGAARSTCKLWNALFKDENFTKHSGTTSAKEIMFIMIRGCRAHLMSVNLHESYNHKVLVDLSIKEIGKLNQVNIIEMLHCDGLLLCVTADLSRLLVWNPSGTIRWIHQPKKNNFHILDRFAIGYDNNNRNVKVLRFYFYCWNPNSHIEYEIFDIESNSWRKLLDVTTDWRIHRRSVSFKGNTYFIAHVRLQVEEGEFLRCFDFTSERFGPRLPLPFHSRLDDSVILSTVGEEKLAVLFKKSDECEIGIWITTMIEPNTMTWSNLLKVDVELYIERFRFPHGSFLVDEKKKVAVVFDTHRKTWTNYKPYMVRENGHYKEVDFKESNRCGCSCALMFQV